MRAIKPTITLLVCLSAAALIWLNFTRYPLGNGRDETDHLQMIDFYQREHRFPVLPDDLENSSEQGHQPPLYYALMASLIEGGLSPLDMRQFEFNPFHLRDNYNPNLPPYNRTLYVQTWASDPPPSIQTAYVFRIVAILINILGIAFVWSTARQLMSNASWLPLVSVSFLMLTPTFWRTAIPPNNNHLLFLFAAMTTWFLTRTLRDGLRWQVTIGIGVVMGLGLLTKVYMLPLLIPIWLVYLLHKRRAIPHLLVIGLLVTMIAGWWYVRNIRLYDDVTAISITEDILESRRVEPLTTTELLKEGITWSGELWVESWTILNTKSSLWVASAIGTGLILSAGLAWVLGLFRSMTIRNTGWLLFGAFVPALIASVSAAARNLHGDYSPPIMLFALPSTSILMGLGILAWTPPRYHARLAISTILLILTGTVIFNAMVFEPQFPALHRYTPPEDVKVANHVSINFENGARLIGYELKDHFAEAGDHTAVKLCWEAPAPIEGNYAFTAKFLLPDLPNAAIQDGYPLSARYPTNAWVVGTAYCEWIPMLIDENAMTPRAYQLFVGMYEVGGEPVNYFLPDGTTSNYLVLDRIGVTSPATSATTSPTPDLAAKIDDWGGLISYDYTIENNTFRLHLTWHPLKTASAPYQYYLHALDADGNILAQLDQQPLNGGYPSDYWQADATFSDDLILEIPDDTTSLKFGMYDPSTFQRGVWTIDGENVGDGLAFPLDKAK